MSYTVCGGKIIIRILAGYILNYIIYGFSLFIGKKNRACICICRIYMEGSFFFFIFPRMLMLLYEIFFIFLHRCSCQKTCLGMKFITYRHNLAVYVITFLFISYHGAFCNKLLEIFFCLFKDLSVMHMKTRIKVYLGFLYMKETAGIG